MSKSKLVKELFIKNFKELLQDLSNTYPSDSTLKLCVVSFNTFVSYKPNYIIDETLLYLEPYSEKILLKDEDFLLEEIERDFSTEDHTWISGEMKRVKELWRSPYGNT